MKVPSHLLVEAGLAAMSAAGKPLTEAPSKGRSMMYRTPEGETVRMRTCNDHILIVLADSDTEGAKLNIEGTDYLLVVMPVQPRVAGPVLVYFVPTAIAAEAARSTHREWLKSSPNTKGDNRAWNLWFGRDGNVAGGFAQKWAKYLIEAPAPAPTPTKGDDSPISLGEVIAAAKASIANAASVKPEAVQISINWP